MIMKTHQVQGTKFAKTIVKLRLFQALALQTLPFTDLKYPEIPLK
jgi:hypothetical protein